MVPASLLNELRRRLVARLDDRAADGPGSGDRRRSRSCRSSGRRCGPVPRPRRRNRPAEPELSALCRTVEQVEAARGAGVGTIYLEFQDIKRYAEGVGAARRGNGDASVFIATTRIEKPGEANLFRYLARQGADGLLVRNAGGLAFCSAAGASRSSPTSR